MDENTGTRPSDETVKHAEKSVEERKTHKVVYDVLKATSGLYGMPYLREFVLALSRALGFKYVLVGELFGPGRGWVRTIALSADGKLVDNFDYALEGTPCGYVVGQKICVYPQGVSAIFPEDKLLVDMGVEGYAGAPLFDLSRVPIGIIACLHDKPMPSEPDIRLVLPHFTDKVAIILERKRNDDERLQIAGAVLHGVHESDMQYAHGVMDEAFTVDEFASGAAPASGRLFARLTDISPDHVFIAGRDMRLLYVNAVAARFLGTTPIEAAGRPLAEFVPPEVFASMSDNIARVFAAGIPAYKEDRFAMHGTEHCLGTRLTPLRSPDGAVAAVLGVGRDITRQMRLMDELRFQRDTARKYLDIAGVIIVVIDRGGNVVLINKKGSDVLGYGEEEAAGLNWFETFIPADEREALRAVFARLMSGDIDGAGLYENRVVTRSGQERVVEWSNTVLTDESDRIVAALSSGADVTEARARERERERLIAELTVANTNVKALTGLLPICASCKRIRDEKGVWQRLEHYIEARTDAGFTHGLCPECVKKAVL